MPPTDHVVSLPISPSEEALNAFESKLRASVIQIMTESGLKWTTIGLWHRGRTPERIDLCPPTILITTLDEDPSNHDAWPAAEAKVREEISKHSKITIEIEVIHGKPTAFRGIDVGFPYPKSIPIGYSFGVAGEPIGVDPQTNNYAKGFSGTLGGYLQLPGQDNMKVAMTCNHIGNPWHLIPNKSELTVVNHEMRCPGNQDNEMTGTKLLSPLMIPSTETFNRESKEAMAAMFETMKSAEFPVELLFNEVKFPADSNRTIYSQWNNFVGAAAARDFVTGMLWMPTAAELQSNEMRRCAFSQTLLSFRQSYDNILRAELNNDSSSDYRQTLNANRSLGVTKYASGHRVAPNRGANDPTDICILDWALVQTNDLTSGTNQIPPKLATLAQSVFPGCPLARSQPISRFGLIKGNDIVFKIGRTTGATVGRVNPSKVSLSTEALVELNAISSDGTLGGQPIKFTNEWAVDGVKLEYGQVVHSGVPPSFAVGGDSGSWVVNPDSELVGMVFSGMDNPFQPTAEKACYVSDMAVIIQSIYDITKSQAVLPPI